MGAATDKVTASTERAKKSAVELGVESQKSFRSALSLITRTTAAIGAMVGAAYGVVKVLERIFYGLDQGALNAAKFQASLGAAVGENARKSLDATADRIQKIDELLAERASKSIYFRLTNSREALEEEKRLLIQSLPGMNQAVQRQKNISDAKKEDAELGKIMADATEQNYKDLADEEDDIQQRKQEGYDADRQEREDKRKAAQDQVDLENSVHDERMARAKELGDAAQRAMNPEAADAADHNAQLRDIEYAKRNARTEEEKATLDFYENQVIDAFVKGLKKREADIRLIFSDIITAAAAQQAGAAGIQGMTVLLGTQVDLLRSISAGMAREYSGPLPGIPGGGY